MRYFGNLVLGIFLTFIGSCVIAEMVSFARWDFWAFNVVLSNNNVLRIILLIGIIIGIYLGVSDGGDI